MKKLALIPFIFIVACSPVTEEANSNGLQRGSETSAPNGYTDFCQREKDSEVCY